MGTWKNIAKDSLRAAGCCFHNGHHRSSISRSYYAIFAAITGALRKVGLHSPADREAWSHPKLQNLVIDNLQKQIGRKFARDIKRFVNENYKMRIFADYTSTQTIDDADARRCLSNATAVFNLLEKGL
ncbi:MAG: HEPN domain-containing protein [Planctomycetota bacterium]